MTETPTQVTGSGKKCWKKTSPTSLIATGRNKKSKQDCEKTLVDPNKCCFHPEEPMEDQCQSCFNKAHEECTEASEDDTASEGLSDAEKKEAIDVCLAHLACEEDAAHSGDICHSWKCSNCGGYPEKMSDTDNTCDSVLLETSRNSSKAGMFKSRKTYKAFVAVTQRAKESIKARQMGSAVQRSGKSTKLDTSMQSKCTA